MGNSVSRPSCLGQKSPRPEDFPEEPCSAARNEEEEEGAGSPEKAALSPRVTENGRNAALPKQPNLQVQLQNGCPLPTQAEGVLAPRTSPKCLGASWVWKLPTTKEVTEVTEVTETVVTEIVEVTEFPSGDTSQEAPATRMVLADITEALPQAAALPGDTQGAGPIPETAGKLGAWVSEVEDLMGHQRPPSGEAKVVEAQLQEQKLLLRLLEERTPHIGRLGQPLSAEPASAAEGQEQPRGLASLQETWATLVQEAKARHHCLQQIVPAASVFQESIDAFQDWLSLTEQKLAQLWGAPGSLAPSQNAHQQIQDLREEVQSKPAELEEALERGWQLLQMVPGEEGQLVQGKVDSLRLRLLLVDQRSSDALQRMEQTLEASPCLDLAQEDPALRLQPPETEQRLPGSQAGNGPGPLAPAGREKPLVVALQEDTESLGCQSPACTLQGQLPLAEHSKVQAELSQWLEEAQQAVAAFLPGSTIGCNAFQGQQEALEGLREAIAEHKPQMGKLQRIAAWLAELCPQEATPLWQRLQVAEDRNGSLREQSQQATAMLEEALPRYSQLSEGLELVAGSLAWLQDHTRHPLALRGDPIWLQEQLWENSLRLVELEKLGVALETLHGQGAELEATLQSTAHPAIQERMQDLWSQWQLLGELEKEREASLQELLALARQFWPGLAKLAGALGNTQRMVLDLEDTTASDPKDIPAKLTTMQALRDKLDALQSELDSLGACGMELMSLCGDPEKPTVTKSLDDLYSSWHSLNRMWAEQQKHLEDQLQASVTDQATMQRLWACQAEAERRGTQEALGEGDPVRVEQELSELKAFKRELYQRQRLWHQEDPPLAFRASRERWTRLEEELLTRQHWLEATVLRLGQFQSQLDWLLQWLLSTEEQLQNPLPLSLDPQSWEIELAKHQVLQKDVLSHSMTVEAMQEAGWHLQLPSDGSGACTEGLQGSLRQLSHRWSQVLAKTEHRQLALEHKLSQVQEVSLEVAGLVQRLDQVELQLFSSKPTWDPSEATKDKLAALLELCEEMESKWQTYQRVQEKLQPPLASCHPNGASTAERSLRALEQKEQLLQSLNTAARFHATLQKLLKWVKQTEEALAALPPPRYILDTVSKQRWQQQALAQEAEAQSKKLAGLAVGAACLTQDNGGPRSLVGSAKEQLAKVLQQVTERGKVLEEAHQQAKQFRESWQLLLKWMDGAESACPAPAGAPPVKPEDLKALLGQHKGFQRCLQAKRPIFEAALQQGGLLCGRALLPADGQELDAMQRELKARWGALWNWAAERQQKLEELLLSSGCFSDALQSLLDWLCWVEPRLAEETPVAGDRDLGTLMEQHKAFQAELGQRAVSVRTLRCSAQELAQGGSSVDTRWLQTQMEELEERWGLIGQLSGSQQNRLEGALRQAEEFHRLLCTFLSRLSGLEKSVMDGAPPEEEEEEALTEGQSQLEELQQRVQCQQLELDCISSLGEEILSAYHPDAVGTVHPWVDLAKSRFQQLCSRVQRQEQRLQAQAASLAVDRKVLERLSDWITAAEEALSLQDQEPLPEDVRQLEELHCQHTVFMQELGHKQAEVEKAAKNGRQERAAQLGGDSFFLPVVFWMAWHQQSFVPAPLVPLEDLEPQNPLLAQLVHRWPCLWLAAQDRQRSQQRHQELEERASFDFAAWRERYLQWIGHRKSRVLDIFHSIDRGQDGRLTQQEFIGRVLASKFPTSLPEMKAVAKSLT